MKKVLITIITRRETPSAETMCCLAAAMSQDYGNFGVLLSMAEWQLAEDAEQNKRANIIQHENAARKMALASDADYFLLLDSDVLPPPHALSALMLQLEQPEYNARMWAQFLKQFGSLMAPKRKHIIGGWFRISPDLYNAGRWVADNTLVNLTQPEHSVTRVDKIDLGCLLISREALAAVSFRPGDIVFNKHQGACACLMFARDLQDAGYDLWMDGSVICKHKDYDAPELENR